MDGLLIFDRSNDLIYHKLNDEMLKKIKELAVAQELISENESLEDDKRNLLMQIFSPIINSQKIMFCQFDNVYTSFQCEEDLKFIFSEFLGYVFLKIGTQTVDNLKKNTSICITFAKYLCGTNLTALKCQDNTSSLLTDLINTWEELYEKDQSILLEGIDQLIVNSDVLKVINSTLKSAVESLQQDTHSQRCHAILFVTQKCSGFYSSRHAQKLAPSDILFLSILSKTLQLKLCTKAINIQSHLIFLQGHYSNSLSGCIPHIVHISLLDKGVALTLLIEYGNLNVASNLYDTFFALQKVQNVQMQGDLDNLKPSFDNLEAYVKQTSEAVKKVKYSCSEIDASFKKFTTRWEFLRKKYLDYFKSTEKELVIKIESNIPMFSEELKELFKVTCLDYGVLEHGFERVSEISTLVEEKLLEFSEFLSVKAQRNLSIESYIQEFPGLVHFIYLDRAIGTITAPDLEPEKYFIPKDKIWAMVELSRSYLRKGHTSIMWKDNAFHYSYFIWFEDQNGTSLKPKDLEQHFTNTNPLKQQYEPGILTGDYYHRLSETFFPKISSTKIKCFELYCIHLGLVTATCALEQSRRLVATISDINGTPFFEAS